MFRATHAVGLMSLLMVSGVIAGADTKVAAAKAPDFEALKQLAGEWIATHEGKTFQVTFHVTSAGSAVMEAWFPGTPDEMITLYTREGSNMAVTHFCALNNQPRLLSKPSSAANQLRFEFESGGNMNVSKDLHSHNLTMTFTDSDHVKEVWDDYKDGKLHHVDIYMLARKT